MSDSGLSLSDCALTVGDHRGDAAFMITDANWLMANVTNNQLDDLEGSIGIEKYDCTGSMGFSDK